jgi:periplasmic protein TonB
MSGHTPEWELKDWAEESRRAQQRNSGRTWARRGGATVATVAAHLLIFLALMTTQPAAPMVIAPEPIEVALMRLPKEEAPKGPAKGPTPAKLVAQPKAKPTPKPKPPKPVARRLVARTVPPLPTEVVPLDAGEVEDIPAPPPPG